MHLVLKIATLVLLLASTLEASELDVARAARARIRGDYKEASIQLERALNDNPEDQSALELNVMIAKSLGKSKDLQATLQKLIKLGRNKKFSPKKMAPYYFELGILQLQNKQFEKSRTNLTFCINQQFNVEASRFFIGFAMFQKGDKVGAAESLRAVLDNQDPDLDGGAHFLLGRIDLENGNSGSANDHFIQAKNLSEQSLKDGPESLRPLMKQIFDQSSSLLGSVKQSSWTIGLLTRLEYDSNVPFSATDNSSTASAKQILLGALQYSGSQEGSVGFRFGARTNYNYNFSNDLAGYQFWVTDIDGHFVFSPKSKSRLGVLLKATVVQRIHYTPSTGSEEIRNFLTGFGAGPTWEVAPLGDGMIKVFATAENLAFASDSDVTDADSKRSGLLIDINTSWSKQVRLKSFNPSIRFGYSILNSSGKENRGTTYSLNAGNLFAFSDSFQIDAILGYASTAYSETSAGTRSDTLTSIMLESSKRLSQKYSLVGRIEYNSGNSSLGSNYGFKRSLVGIGISAIF